MSRSVHKIIMYLILGEVLLFGGFGLIGPIFAIFITQTIDGGTIAAVGFSQAIYLITQTALKIPIGLYTDKERGNKREAWTLFIGTIMMALVPLLYLVAGRIEHIYLIQFFYGIAFALGYPGWMALFTRFAGREREGYEWSLYSTFVVGGAGITAAIGGTVAEIFGFRMLFYMVFLAGLASALSYGVLLWYTLRNAGR